MSCKEKAVQTEWILNKIDFGKITTSARETVLNHFARTHFSKFVDSLKDSSMQSQVDENSICKIGATIEEWNYWRTGEFEWKPINGTEGNIENQMKEEEGKEGISKLKKPKIKENDKRKNKGKINAKDLDSLRGMNWLNDEIINQYFELISETYEGVYPFNSFFFPRLHIGGYNAIKRWTRKIDIFKYALIMVPIHPGNHWCVITISPPTETVTYFDSFQGKNSQYLKTVMGFIMEETREKKGVTIKMGSWTLTMRKDTPKQLNGYDCGVFACLFTRYEAARLEIDFTQRNIPQIREKMIRELQINKLIQ
ncbi:sentrin-specific protease-like [Venturia canescens]|uniref:sentrin-specific protease-like n=1 Tax=Venturia canescens TaxID=32260 RepID=UPI001C9BECEF|nr:sentrin-specific protease-like [Venturia canescens]